MTEGLRKYAGLYQVDLLEAGTAYINVSYMAHDLSINIPLITTEGHTPLDLSLYFVLSRKTSLDEYYGKGTSSSFRYRVSSSQSPVITFPSGDEYSFTYASTNIYKNVELNATYNASTKELIFKDNTKLVFIYPESYNFYKGDKKKFYVNESQELNVEIVKQFDVDSTIDRINGEMNQDDKIFNVLYTYNKVLYKVSINYLNGFIHEVSYYSYSTDNVESFLYKNTYNFENGYIEVISGLSSKYTKFNLDSDDKVISVNEAMNSSYSGQITTLISYYPIYVDYESPIGMRSVITNYLGETKTILFDETGLTAIQSFSSDGIVNYVRYDAHKNIIRKINNLNYKREYCNLPNHNILTNGFFDNGTTRWTIENGSGSIVNETTNPLYEIIGSNALAIYSYYDSTRTIVSQEKYVTILDNEPISIVLFYRQAQSGHHNYSSWFRIRIRFYKGTSLYKEELTDINVDDSAYKSWNLFMRTYNFLDTIDRVYISFEVNDYAGYKVQGVQIVKKVIGLTCAYDSNNNLIEVNDGIRDSLSVYDTNNKPTTTIGNLANLYSYEGDNLSSEVSSIGLITSYEYNSNNKVTKTTSNTMNSYILQNEYFYASNQEQFLCKSDTCTGLQTPYNRYDSNNNVIRSELMNRLKIDYQYDKFNNVNLLTYRSYSETELAKISSTYSNSNQIEYLYKRDNNKTNYKFTYNNDSMLKKVSVGEDDSYSYDIVNYEYKNENNASLPHTNLVTKKTYGNNGDSFMFAYDNKERIVSTSLAKPNQSPQTLFTYNYDSYNRLISIINNRNSSRNIGYEYDNENRISKETENSEYSKYNYQSTGELSSIYSNKTTYKIKSISSTSSTHTSPIYLESSLIYNQVKGLDDDQEMYYTFFSAKDDLRIKSCDDAVAVKYAGGYQTFAYNSTCLFFNVRYTEEGHTPGIVYTTVIEKPANNKTIAFFFKIDSIQSDTSLLVLLVASANSIMGSYAGIRFFGSSIILEVRSYNQTTSSKIAFIPTNIIDFTKWNFLSLTIQNGTIFKLKINEFTATGTLATPFDSLSSSYVKETICYMCTLDPSGKKHKEVLGSITGLMYKKNYLPDNEIDSYYNIVSHGLNERAQSFSSSTNITIDNISNLTIPLHNDYYGYKNNNVIKPVRSSINTFSSTLSKIPSFYYSEKKNCHSYYGEGKELVYDIDLSSSGTILCNVVFDKNYSTQYIYKAYGNNYSFGIYRDTNSNRMMFTANGTSYTTLITLNNNTEYRIGFSWIESIISDSQGSSYQYNITIEANGQTYVRVVTTEEHMFLPYLSIGRNNIVVSYYPLYGYISDVVVSTTCYDLTNMRRILNASTPLSSSTQYDSLSRLSSIKTRNNIEVVNSYVYKSRTNGDNKYTSNQIVKEEININGEISTYYYEYSSTSRITRIGFGYSDPSYINYTYSDLGYLTSDNRCSYTYDARGNITSKVINGVTYSYEYDSTYKDRLIRYNNQNITYEASSLFPSFFGNVSYSFEGSRLVSYVSPSLNISYTYDSSSYRLSKTVNGLTTIYKYVDNLLVCETNANYTNYFNYNESGMLISITSRGNTYLYVRNMLGVIDRLVDSNGNTVVSYYYDGYGNIISVGGSLQNSLGKENPFRYKGYYYDEESKYYYLLTRYYVPELGRFLSPDSIDYLDPSTVEGLNLYAYCGNDPISYADPSGHFPQWANWLIGGAIIVGLGIATIVTGGAAAGVAGFIVAGAFKGAVIGAVSGALVSGAIRGITSAISGDDFWEGFLDSAADGFMSGAILGGITGAIGSAVQVSNASKLWANTGNKTAYRQMVDHYSNHVIREGQTGVAKNIVNYSKQASNFFINNSTSGNLLRQGVIKISGAPGGIFNANGLIRSFWYILR